MKNKFSEPHLSLSSSTNEVCAVTGARYRRHTHTVSVRDHHHQAAALRSEQADFPIIPRYAIQHEKAKTFNTLAHAFTNSKI